MARRKDRDAGALSSPTVSDAEAKALEDADAGKPYASTLPTLEAPETGKIEQVIDPPISLFIKGVGGLLPGQCVGMECWGAISPAEGVPAAAASVAVKARRQGETLYHVKRTDMAPPISIGTFAAEQLVLPEQALPGLKPKPKA